MVALEKKKLEQREVEEKKKSEKMKKSTDGRYVATFKRELPYGSSNQASDKRGCGECANAKRDQLLAETRLEREDKYNEKLSDRNEKLEIKCASFEDKLTAEVSRNEKLAGVNTKLEEQVAHMTVKITRLNEVIYNSNKKVTAKNEHRLSLQAFHRADLQNANKQKMKPNFVNSFV